MLFKTFLRIFGSRSVMFSFGSIVVISLLGIIHLALSFCNNNFNWLGAFGALLTVYSLLLGFTHSVYPDFEKDSEDPVLNKGHQWVELPTVKGALADVVSEEYAKKTNSEHREAIANKYKSLVNIYYISILGTILWAYSGFIKI
ncbi:hypothetical protein J5X91_17815 [Pseudoalteromonas sp. K222D]|uniref:hypothetical protein n=1 Tax=Pseudoalteromonas sp. K222D TaxID=2820756 RepID=UPI001AD61277|nr:hypothetical protein [Pseudoalteromonas sp. K222D]MBO7928094.1 hypothetical protein [Pseudoalteromonas sp. K222D]